VITGPWNHHEADVGEVRLHGVEAGRGPLVLLLHGFPEFWYGWRHQIPPLAAAGYRVVAPDLRGYNRSDPPRGIRNYRMASLIGDVEGLIRVLGEDRAVVVGHDWGGVVAWETAMRFPARVEGLVVLNAPHPAAFARELRTLDQLRRSWYAFFFQIPGLPEAILRAGDFALIRRIFLEEPRRRGAFRDEDVSAHVQSLARLRISRSGSRRGWSAGSPICASSGGPTPPTGSTTTNPISSTA